VGTSLVFDGLTKRFGPTLAVDGLTRARAKLVAVTQALCCWSATRCCCRRPAPA